MLCVHSFAAILALHCLFSVSSAFLFAGCRAFKRERIDPIVSYGQESSHMHTFFGSSAISPTSNSSEMLRKGCTSCDNALDTSAYWIPTMYYVTNTSRTPVEVGFRAYYQGQGSGEDKFPEDYRIIVGNPRTTADNVSAAVDSGVNFYCRAGGVKEDKKQYELVTQPCGIMNGNIGFPGSVVFDPTLDRYRKCQKGDTGCLHVPGMFYSVSYYLGSYKFLPGEYLELSTGAGYTYHADFMMGWAKSALDQLSHDPTADLQIGAPDSLKVPSQCLDSPARNSNLSAEDRAYAKKIYQVSGDISGTYGYDLTITDGMKISGESKPVTMPNSTWTWNTTSSLPTSSEPTSISPISSTSIWSMSIPTTPTANNFDFTTVTATWSDASPSATTQVYPTDTTEGCVTTIWETITKTETTTVTAAMTVAPSAETSTAPSEGASAWTDHDAISWTHDGSNHDSCTH